MANNMRIYQQVHEVPKTAIKPIQAGRLKGMSDINPMWRIEKLTEVYGPCGIGWWYKITDKQIIDDEQTMQRAAFLDIELFVRDPETGEVSQAIIGTGGASFVTQERNGAYLSDECFKMALTDAISVACKALGFGADVYYPNGMSKYSQAAEAPGSKEAAEDAGKKKLAEMEAKIAEAAKHPVNRAMATTEQKAFITQSAPEDLYMKTMQQYGANLETMTEPDAAEIIKYIKAHAK